MQLDALGSGSDFSSFLQHLAVPSLNLGFGGESNGGDYHSIYDSYDNYIRFKDPGFITVLLYHKLPAVLHCVWQMQMCYRLTFAICIQL